MARPEWVPDEIDVNQPSVARIYDYNLGGYHNFASDRRLAEEINKAMPTLPAVNRANRLFLGRAVHFLAEAGIRQYLDLGSGIPTAGNVHEVAQTPVVDARVVYVDFDAVAVAHSRAILAGNPRATAIRADLREVERVLDDPQVRRLLDFTQPIAVLMVAVLHFVSDVDDPAGIVARYRDATLPGSYLVISHATDEGEQRTQAEAVTEVSARSRIDLTLRDRTEVARFFDGYRLVPPGLVFTPQWRPDGADDEFSNHPGRSATLAGVGVRLPG
jgi:hypothetical protein